jgi:drug/metabolite transporter (DMT)-like permease
VLAPFWYTQIVPMIALGYLVFGDVPDAVTLIGAAIVLSSGLYVWWRERIRKRDLA